MRRACLFALGVGLLGSAACGDPQGGDDTDLFTFTPVPVYTVVATPMRVEDSPLSLDDQCNAFIADEVQALVGGSRLSEFEEWLKTVGFTIRRRLPRPDGFVLILVGVPLGSVPDAVRFVARQPGVESVDPNYVLYIPESPSPGERLGCTPVPEFPQEPAR